MTDHPKDHPLNRIRVVEIELHSQCNRTCSWCPNNFIDRKSTNTFMDPEIFKSLIDELAEWNYSKFISFSRYNEPFMHKENFIEKIKYIREKLPNAKLITNTNGDFDTSGVDLDELTVMDYDKKKEPGISLDRKVRIMRLEKVQNRGGLLKFIKGAKRTEPCMEPTYFVGIDYTGDVMPCCNFRSDAYSHKKYILGNLANKTLANMLTDWKASAFRYMCAKGEFIPGSACEFCTKGPGRYRQENPDIGGTQG